MLTTEVFSDPREQLSIVECGQLRASSGENRGLSFFPCLPVDERQNCSVTSHLKVFSCSQEPLKLSVTKVECDGSAQPYPDTER
jgi:hypothetical protein